MYYNVIKIGISYNDHSETSTGAVTVVDGARAILTSTNSSEQVQNHTCMSSNFQGPNCLLISLMEGKS